MDKEQIIDIATQELYEAILANEIREIIMGWIKEKKHHPSRQYDIEIMKKHFNIWEAEDYEKGEKVTYIGNPRQGIQHGMVRKIHPEQDRVAVVFNCGGNWENFENYTAARCKASELEKGWATIHGPGQFR